MRRCGDVSDFDILFLPMFRKTQEGILFNKPVSTESMPIDFLDTDEMCQITWRIFEKPGRLLSGDKTLMEHRSVIHTGSQLPFILQDIFETNTPRRVDNNHNSYSQSKTFQN